MISKQHQELENFEDINLLMEGDIVRICDENGDKAEVIFWGVDNCGLCFWKIDPESGEHAISFRIPMLVGGLGVENGMLVYNSGQVSERQIHKDYINPILASYLLQLKIPEKAYREMRGKEVEEEK